MTQIKAPSATLNRLGTASTLLKVVYSDRVSSFKSMSCHDGVIVATTSSILRHASALVVTRRAREVVNTDVSFDAETGSMKESG